MLRIVETTDNRFIGTVVENLDEGMLILDEFVFDIVGIRRTTRYVTAYNTNYVIIFKEI